MAGELDLQTLRTLTHFLGHDATGLAGRMPIGRAMTPRSFNTWVGLGDSTIEQLHLDTPVFRNRSAYNHYNVANALSGNRVTRCFNFGKSGERTDQVLARLDAALATGAGVLLISEAINNFGQAPYVHAVTGVTVSALESGAAAFADTLKKVDAALDLGMRVVVALCHGSSNFTAAMIKQLVIYNAALRRMAELRPNVWLIDAPSVLHDPTTSQAAIVFRTNYMRSGEGAFTHEAMLGSFYVGKLMAKVMPEIVPRVIPRNSVDGSNQRTNGMQLANNPLLTATSGSAGIIQTGGALASGTTVIPFEWLFRRVTGDTTTTFTLGVEPNPDGNGNDAVIDYNVTTAGGGVRMTQDLAGTGLPGDAWLPGTIVQGFGKITVMPGSTGLASAQTQIEMSGTLDGATVTQVTHSLLNDLTHGVYPSTEGFSLDLATEPLLVPSYSARAYLSFRALELVCATPGTGRVRVNMPHLAVLSPLVA
jgi:hypothetical protein